MPKISFSKSGNYLINGDEYARVTNIVSMIDRRELTEWKARIGIEEANRIAKETADFGERVHRMTVYNDKRQKVLLDEMLTNDESLVPFWAAWLDWKMTYVEKWVAIELLVWSDKLRCAGRIDRVGYSRGDKRLTAFDIKTGSLYDEIGIQLAGYRILYNETRKPKIIQVKVIHMPRKTPGELKVKDYTNPKYLKRFKDAAKLYQSLKFNK